MHVLFADTLPDATLEAIRAAGFICDVQPDLTEEGLAGAMKGVDVLVVRSTKVGAAAIEAGDSLGLVVRAGAGTNTIDVATAAASAVQVANVPGQNAIAVAELTMGLILSLDRRIADAVADSREGRWDKKTYSKGRGLYGRSLGIVGFGAIGMAVAHRAAAFGMKIVGIANDRRPVETKAALEELGTVEVETLADLAAACHVITFHVPASENTKGLMGAPFLAHVRPGTIIINTSRGDTIDEEALLVAIDEKNLWVGLDVYPQEPSSGEEFASALAAHPRVYGTHHIGASTRQAQEAVGDRVVEIVQAYAAGSELSTVVNFAERAADAVTVVVRHKNRVGVLSHALAALRGAGLNVEDMTNRIFEGGDAAVATIHVTGGVTAEVIATLQAVEHVVSVASTT